MAITKLNSLAIPDDTIVEADLSYPLTGFSSTGIDDNATSTAITIDSLGRTQIGTTSAYNSYADNLVVEDDSNCGITIATTDTTARTSLYFADGAVVGADQYRGIIEYRHSSNSMHFWTDATDHGIVINSSGNVGIGTTSPSSLLDVSSGTNTDGTDVTITVGGTSANTRQSLITKKIQSSDRALEFYAASGGSSEDIRFFRDNTNETMRINASGNVGIGTTSPTAKLHVEGSINANATFNVKDSNTNDMVRMAYVSSLPNGVSGMFVTSDASHGQAYGSLILHTRYDYAGYSMGFRVGNAERIRIKDNGNVGIGTTSPTGLLTLGTGTFSAAAANTSALYTSTTAGLVAVADGLLLVDRAGSDVFKVSNSGNVGIGASSPSRQLVVYDSTYPAIALQNSASGTTLTDGFQMQYDGTAYLWNYENSAMLFGTNSAERMRIQTDGQVLIGTSSVLSGGIDGIHLNTAADTGITFAYSGTVKGWLYYIVGAAMQLQTPTGTTIRMVSDSNGVQLTNGATSWSSLSDERKKDIIEPITNAAEKVSTLRTVIGKYKEEDEGTRRAFLIAQDVQKVLPEAVGENDDGDLLLQYTETIPLLVAAIKEQQAQITELKAEVAALKGA